MDATHQLTRILLVEDTLDLAEVIKRELVIAGYAVIHAPDGPTALQYFSERVPDVVLLDWMLPGMDGLEVLRRMRQFSAVPILMLTARGEEVDRVVGLEVGADDYLTKPFSMRELIARVHALLRRAERIQAMLSADRAGQEQGEQSEVLHLGTLTLDVRNHRVLIDENEIDFSKTEFDLLYLLLRNPNRAFSRAYLLDTLWGETYIGGDRSVDNAMLRLRKKLGPLGEHIETVWGVGYRLKP
jgi:DNA-binding response OmpR family regulator